MPRSRRKYNRSKRSPRDSLAKRSYRSPLAKRGSASPRSTSRKNARRTSKNNGTRRLKRSPRRFRAAEEIIKTIKGIIKREETNFINRPDKLHWAILNEIPEEKRDEYQKALNPELEKNPIVVCNSIFECFVECGAHLPLWETNLNDTLRRKIPIQKFENLDVYQFALTKWVHKDPKDPNGGLYNVEACLLSELETLYTITGPNIARIFSRPPQSEAPPSEAPQSKKRAPSPGSPQQSKKASSQHSSKPASSPQQSNAAQQSKASSSQNLKSPEPSMQPAKDCSTPALYRDFKDLEPVSAHGTSSWTFTIDVNIDYQTIRTYMPQLIKTLSEIDTGVKCFDTGQEKFNVAEFVDDPSRTQAAGVVVVDTGQYFVFVPQPDEKIKRISISEGRSLSIDFHRQYLFREDYDKLLEYLFFNTKSVTRYFGALHGERLSYDYESLQDANFTRFELIGVENPGKIIDELKTLFSKEFIKNFEEPLREKPHPSSAATKTIAVPVSRHSSESSEYSEQDIIPIEYTVSYSYELKEKTNPMEAWGDVRTLDSNVAHAVFVAIDKVTATVDVYDPNGDEGTNLDTIRTNLNVPESFNINRMPVKQVNVGESATFLRLTGLPTWRTIGICLAASLVLMCDYLIASASTTKRHTEFYCAWLRSGYHRDVMLATVPNRVQVYYVQLNIRHIMTALMKRAGWKNTGGDRTIEVTRRDTEGSFYQPTYYVTDVKKKEEILHDGKCGGEKK